MNKNKQIRYHKWKKKDFKLFSKTISKLIGLKDCQCYMPLFSLFFYIHNTPYSHKIIDFDRKYYITELNEIIKERYYNSNLILKGNIYDSSKNIYEEKDIFCKSIPILDPIHCINNNYNMVIKNNYHLPTGYNYNTFSKINNINNGAYIDTFCSFLFSQLVINKKLPSFAIYYGSVNGIGNYKYDMTEEYDDFKLDKCFNKNLGKSFKLDIYLSDEDSENDSDNDSDNDLDNDSENDSYSDGNDDYIAQLKDVPIQLLFIEKLEGTLEDYLLSDTFEDNVLLSCIFQISFSLHYLQKHYKFTHNDLHINNVMYSYTETKYIYYKINNKYYKVPTYGKIFKIIDFGRSILTYKNKVYLNDVFSKHGEAGGQYYYPNQAMFHTEENEENKIMPNYNFDMCRLSMTILEEIDVDNIKNKRLLKLLYDLCSDNGNSFCDMTDDFNLYISIAKNACNSLPIDILNNNIFKEYSVKKKKFPTKSYYCI